ncbi:MAG: helix-turn-helix transcriptional regulator [Cytophagales bacterium]|nr:helix-turn-helix transcriptional regulator [Cytophagales bacterium]
MVDYNKIIESLSIRFDHSNNIALKSSLTIDDFFDVANTIILNHKGPIYFGEKHEKIGEGDMLFIPGGRKIPITFGENSPMRISQDDYIIKKERFLTVNKNKDLIGSQPDSYSCVSFEAKVFNSVNFFASLDIPAFIISKHDKLAESIVVVAKETLENLPGKERVIKIYTEHIVVEIIRYILKNNLFIEELTTNSTYFNDPRLINMFAYIKENLGNDLSNKKLAKIAGVSEDYVGQYFKLLTGINPQDYIEYQRMEYAIDLLRSTKKSIREIGEQIGFRDTAYFCRRFKMMFGIPAGKMRKRELLMNI